MAIDRLVFPLFALLLSGCAGQVYYSLPSTDAGAPQFAVPEDEGPLVGIAISGGGSRAATYAAAVLEELAKIPVGKAGEGQRSLIEAVNYVSAVSGGSLAATYFGLLKPGREVPALNGLDLSPPYRSFFQKFGDSMQRDFEAALIKGVLLDRDWGVNSIANEWDAKIFNGATFSDLYSRQQKRDSPTLILNATSLDNGRRFLFTTLPRKSFEFNLAHEIAIRLTSNAVPEEELRALRKEIDDEAIDHVPMTFDEIAADPRRLRLSLAVAGSSAVPYVIGPLILGVNQGTRQQLYQLADGGLVDNQGLESLFQLFAAKLRPEGTAAVSARPKGIIIAIDASLPVIGGAEKTPEAESRLQSLTRNPIRLTAIMERSGKNYRLLLWSVLRGTQIGSLGVVPGFDDFRIVSLRHVDASAALARQPPAECVGMFRDSMTSAQMKERLAQIYTRYEISDRCDVALLRAAAHTVVGDNAKRIAEFFR